MNHAGVPPRHLAYALLKQITDGFSEERVIGSGGYGKVYLGVHKDGKKIAVKMLYDMPGLDDEQFIREFNNLTSLQHNNIVQFVGYCYETQQEWVHYNGKLVLAHKIYRALCFEYMHNGSLHENLSDEYNGHDWHTRYGIIKGICDGLKYLHEDLKPPMYHLDLKPANILLGENMVSRIADFGLSKLFGQEQTRITKSSIGTHGYLPPEYIERNVVSKKFDIFSLGVVTIKIMTGRTGYYKSADMTSQEFIKLVHAKWRNRLQVTLTSVCVLESYSEQVKKCIEIALRCVDADRHKRPSIGDIVNELNKTETTIHQLSQFLRSLSDDPMSLMDQAESVIQKGPRENLQDFIDERDRLTSLERFFISNKSYTNSDEILSRVNALLSKAIVKMEGEFKNLLSHSRKPVEPDHLFACLPSRFRPSCDQFPPRGEITSSTGPQTENPEHSEADVYKPPALIEPKFIPLLAELAKELVQAGRQQQCSEIYSEARASTLESSLKRLGVETPRKTEMQAMDWEILESKIGNWIVFVRISVKLLFVGERQLCDQVFEHNQPLTDKCVAAITENSLAMLLSFGEAVATGKRSTEILFALLDMYEIIGELQTEIDTIFVGESCCQMRESILGLRKCLVQSVQTIFSDFEEAVENDRLKLPNDGTVTPLAYYVINYIKFIFDYKSTLEQCHEFKRDGGTGFDLTAVTMSIIKALQKNLDAKANKCKDPALMHIFLMNNNHYIVRSVRRSELKDSLGDDWIQKQRRNIQESVNLYRRVTLSKVLECLSSQSFSSSEPSTTAVKDRFGTFNMLFEEIYQTQCGWCVPDLEMRESLRVHIMEILLPAYRSFLERFGPLINNSEAPGKYIKYTPEQLEQLLGDLFEDKEVEPPVPVCCSSVIGMRKLMSFSSKNK